MPNDKKVLPETNRLLVKLRPSNALGAADRALTCARSTTRPAGDGGRLRPRLRRPQWYLADLPDGAATPWDLAHARVADQLGVAESDVIFAEPDIVHRRLPRHEREESAPGFAAGEKCNANPQDGRTARRVGPERIRLAPRRRLLAARLGARRGRVHRPAHAHRAHRHGLLPLHDTVPEHMLARPRAKLRRRRRRPDSAEDPDNRVIVSTTPATARARSASSRAARFRIRRRLPRRRARTRKFCPCASPTASSSSARARSRSALEYAVEQRCDVVTLSMGGLPSRAWNEA